MYCNLDQRSAVGDKFGIINLCIINVLLDKILQF